MKKCKLCQINLADKKKSHILSKFLGKELFVSTPHHHSIAIGQKGSNHKVQDTVKEDYIFCSYCEKRMEIIETYFAKKLKDIYNYKKNPSGYELLSIYGQDYLKAKKLKLSEYNLFFYLQVWRISISESKYYSNYKLPINIESELCNFLNVNLKNNHQELINQLNNIINPPKFTNCFIIPKDKNEFTRGLYTAYEFAKDSYIIIALNFAFMLFTNENNTQLSYKYFDNSKNDFVKIFLGNNNTWRDLNKTILHKLIT